MAYRTECTPSQLHCPLSLAQNAPHLLQAADARFIRLRAQYNHQAGIMVIATEGFDKHCFPGLPSFEAKGSASAARGVPSRSLAITIPSTASCLCLKIACINMGQYLIQYRFESSQVLAQPGQTELASRRINPD